MDLGKEIRTLNTPIVIVDDMYAPPEVLDEVSQSSAELLYVLRHDRAALRSVKGILGKPRLSAERIVKQLSEGKGLDRLWSAYEHNREGHRFLDIIFNETYVVREKNLRRLRAIEKFSLDLTGQEAARYASLEEARQDLKDCAIAFVDFRLGGPAANDAAIVDSHGEYRDCYQAQFSVNGRSWPKLMVLISSSLPKQSELARFREITGIRSAFFSPMRKTTVTEKALAKAFKQWAAGYPAAAELNTYLAKAEEAVTEIARGLAADISRIEVHDLALLQVLRLAAEQESLHAYVNWLLSESMAARLRSHPQLTNVQMGPAIENAPLDGKLLAASVLFEMFADVASSSIPADGHLAQGDVFVLKDKHGKATDNAVVAISPACDLLRCELAYNVLCVRGKIVESGTSLHKLVDANKGLFGKGRHVLRMKGGARPSYMRVTWDEKQGLHSVMAADLLDKARYERKARLSESFAQEIKELALSHASRIGVPMDPAFAVRATVVVRMTSGKRDRESEPVTRMHDLSDAQFTSVVISVAKVPNKDVREIKATFTPQFVEWVERFIDDFEKECGDWTPPELQPIREYFEAGAPQVSVKANGVITKADGKVSFSLDMPFPDDGTKSCLEIHISTTLAEEAD